MSTLIRTPGRTTAPARPARVSGGAFSWSQVRAAAPGAVRKLDPRQQWRNPVMFVVWVGAVLTTALAVAEPFFGGAEQSGRTTVPSSFTGGIAVWLWLTVLFANLAEAVAESRGKAQADSLRKTRTSTVAHRVTRYDEAVDPSAVADAALVTLVADDTAVISITSEADVDPQAFLAPRVLVSVNSLVAGDA